MAELRVETASGQYSVWIGRGLFPAIPGVLRGLLAPVSRVFVVTSPEVDKLWGEPLRAPLQASGLAVSTLHVPAGEPHKRLSTIERLCEELAGAGADRDSVLLALGGGVIGDVTGFLAAIYMRGIRFVQVPTTLLAQVDSSVGGKTGVNLAAGKNLVGSFHQPVAVFADAGTLRTLPERELRAGLQESVKSAVIRDAALFAFMEVHAGRILRGDPEALLHVVEASVRMKAAVVAEDERETGVRMILNFGHTVGHAIEAATQYRVLLHGEAIGWGMIAALRLAQGRGAIAPAEAERIAALVHRYTDLPAFDCTAEQLVVLTANDKKARSGTLSFVLPRGIGSVEMVRDVAAAELHRAVEAMLSEMRQRGTAGQNALLAADYVAVPDATPAGTC